MSFFRKLLLNTIIISAIVNSTDSRATVVWQDDNLNPTVKRSQLLDRALSPTQAKGYAGITPVTYVNGKTYMLISRERSGPDIGSYCDFGGKVDPNESYLKAMIRECHEESSAVYDFKNEENQFRNQCIMYFNDREVVLSFYTTNYIKRQDFMNATAKQLNNKNWHFCEKDDFIWVDTEHLYNNLHTMGQGERPPITLEILNDDATTGLITVNLRGLYAAALKRGSSILKHYVAQRPKQVAPIVCAEPVANVHTVIKSLKEINKNDFQTGTLLLIDLDKILNKKGADFNLVEPDIALTIEALKTCVSGNNADVVILGITTEGVNENNGRMNKVDEYLKKVKISASRLKFVDLNSLKLSRWNDESQFKNGVIYAGTDRKDQAFFSFIEEAGKAKGYKPSKLIICDGTQEQLDRMLEMAGVYNIPMNGYLIS